jgi:hypothetical protein
MLSYSCPTRIQTEARSSRILLVATLALGVVAGDGLTSASDAEARPRPAGRSRASRFEANKTFGLGIMLGAPTGLSGKYFLGPDTALDFGVGTIYNYRDRRGVHLHLDFLWHPATLAKARPFELPLYFGIGGRLLNGRRCYHWDRHGYCDYYYDDYTALGVRAPVGIAFDFNNVPIDIFFELALVLDVLVDYDDRYDEHFLYGDLNGAIGFRYYFN